MGESLGVLDIAWFIYAHRLSLAGYPLKRLHPRVHAWVERLRARPEFAKEIDAPERARLEAARRRWRRKNAGGSGRVLGFVVPASAFVMAGHSRPKDGVASLAYVPAIHAFLCYRQGVDARHKAGHDEHRCPVALAFALLLDRVPDHRRDVRPAEILDRADTGGRGDVDLGEPSGDHVDADEQQAPLAQRRADGACRSRVRAP